MDYFESELASIFFLMSAATAVAGMSQKRRVTAPRRSVRRRPRQEFWDMTSILSDEDFQAAFRIKRDTFKGLVDVCRPHISPRYAREEDREKEIRSHVAGKDIQTEVKVAMFLRTMAGGSFHDIRMLFGVARASIFRIFRHILATVLRVLPWECFPHDDDLAGFKDMALAFSLSRGMINPLPGCVGAVDGLQVPIICPPRDHNPLHYFSRKGFFSLPVQAIVDANYRFVGCSVLAVGATHDNAAFMLSEFYRYLESGDMPKGFWVAGDEAYTCTETLLIPFARSISSPVHDGFNFFLSSHRVHVEQAFGILKKRWGILQKPLAFDIALATKIVPAAMKLHNFCINMDGGIPKPPRTMLEIQLAQERLEFWLTWCNEGFDVDDGIAYEVEEMSASARRAEQKSETRGKLVKIVRRENLMRPEFSPPPESADMLLGSSFM